MTHKLFFQEEGWKLNRNHYYQEGWLSTANQRGVVGVTYTSSHCGEGENQLTPPPRTNYNLRGHRAEVGLYFFAQKITINYFYVYLQNGAKKGVFS